DRGDRPCSESQVVVLVVDTNSERASQIGAAVRQLGASVQFEIDPTNPLNSFAGSPLMMAVIALGQNPATGSPELSAIRALRAGSVAVIAYAEGLRDW